MFGDKQNSLDCRLHKIYIYFNYNKFF
jgi:hypothetical protein